MKEDKNKMKEKREALQWSLFFLFVFSLLIFAMTALILSVGKELMEEKGMVIVSPNILTAGISFGYAFILTVGYYVGTGEPDLESKIIWIWIFGTAPAVGLICGWQLSLISLAAYGLGSLAGFVLLRSLDREVRFSGLLS